MRKHQIAAVGLILAAVFCAAAAAFQWGLAGISTVGELDEINMRLEPEPTVREARERLAQLEAIPCIGVLAPERMQDLRSGMSGLELALAELQEARDEHIRRVKYNDFRSKLIGVKVDRQMTAKGLGFVRGFYRFLFLLLCAAALLTAIGRPGIGAIITLVAALISIIGFFIDTHLGYAVSALGFMQLALFFGMSMSILPADHRLIAHTEKRLAHTDQAGQRRIFRRDMIIGLIALVAGAVL